MHNVQLQLQAVSPNCSFAYRLTMDKEDRLENKIAFHAVQ